MDNTIVPTKKVINEYLENITELKTRESVKSAIDRVELYEYEQKIGKQVFHFSSEEAMEMLLTIRGRGSGVQKERGLVNVQTLKGIKNRYLNLVDFYIERYETVKNPFRGPIFRGDLWTDDYFAQAPKISYNKLLESISKLYIEYPKEMAEYIECVVLLFYCGFQSSEEILDVKESDVNVRARVVRTKYGAVRLNKRCMELLQEIHSKDTIKKGKFSFQMCSWHDSYFKFSIRNSQHSSEFQDVSRGSVMLKITQSISNDFGAVYGSKICGKDIFYLGLYDRMVAEFRLNRVEEILNSRDYEDNAFFTQFLIRNNLGKDYPNFQGKHKSNLKVFL